MQWGCKMVATIIVLVLLLWYAVGMFLLATSGPPGEGPHDYDER